MGNIIFKNKPPIFKNKIYFGRPNSINKTSLYKKFDQILKNKWLTNDGPYVREFENKVSKYLKVKYCIAVCNATLGLEILEKALNLTGEVILPSMTFIASPNSLLWQGINPVFCDIEQNSWNIDPSKIENLINSKTSAIMGVHVFGRPCNIEKLKYIAQKHKLHLFYDAAHAFGNSYQNTMIGNFGEAEVFSFHATKFFNSIEGGAITTNNHKLAKRLRMIRNFGFTGHDKTESLGINAKMNEFSAAFGITSFENISNIIKANQANYYYYQKHLSNIPGIKLINFDSREKNNYQYIIIEVDKLLAKISRDQLVKILWSENIIARRYFYPGCHRMKPYTNMASKTNKLLINTNYLTNRTIALPTGTEINEQKIIKISSIIKHCVHFSNDIVKQFKSNTIDDLTGIQEIIQPKL